MARYLILLGIVLAAATGWILALPLAPVAQPLAFNHAKHNGLGCAVCHRGAEAAARAGIPQGKVCLKCHTTAPAGLKTAMWDGIARGSQIDWVRVTRVPDHVTFSHRRHVGAGRLECASCHAGVAQRLTPPGTAPVRLDMDACLSCHKREGASEDCAACHR